jgi:hypothetical protein
MNNRTTIYALIALVLSVTAGLAQSGKWIPKAKPIGGTWSISEKGGKKVLILKDFKTSNAPDLKIFLSPRASGQLTSKNATTGSVRVAKLKSTNGDQSYELPEGVDLSKYKSIVIHCEQYSKLWGVGTL